MALQCCVGSALYQHEQPYFPLSLADPIFLPPPVNSVLQKQLDDICWNERVPVWSCNVTDTKNPTGSCLLSVAVFQFPIQSALDDQKQSVQSKEILG